MLDIGVFIKIISEAIKSIKSDSDDEPITKCCGYFIYYLTFYTIPFACALLPFFIELKLSDMESFIGTGISIFTGLFFSLLLGIGSKIKTEKENPNIDLNNYKQYRNNMRQISNITQYVIILGVVIMAVVLANYILKGSNIYIEKSMTAIVMYLLVKFVVCLFFMLQRFYYVLRDELGNIM
jgi:hypothetical protein